MLYSVVIGFLGRLGKLTAQFPDSFSSSKAEIEKGGEKNGYNPLIRRQSRLGCNFG